MVIVTFLVMLVLAIIFTLVLIYGLNRRGPWQSGWTLFIIILFGIWASSLWVNPVGPVVYDVSWVPLVFAGIVISLLLAAATPEDSKRIYTKSIAGKEDKGTRYSVSIFFWLFIITLGLIIIFGYWR